jgi:PAS domain S-box-containing protein
MEFAMMRAGCRSLLDPAYGLSLLLAAVLVLLASFGDRGLGGNAQSSAILAVAGLGLAALAMVLAFRRQARVAAEADMQRRLADLAAQIAASSAALAASEARLRRAQRIGRVGGFEIDLQSGVNRRSGEYMSVQGEVGEARIEQHRDWVARLHPADRERAERNFFDVISSNSDVIEYAQEYRIITPSGETRWIAARAEIERDAQGCAIRMVGAHVDVTELKTAEAALRASEERLRLAQEAAGLGIWERDLRTGRAVWSAEQFRLMGVDPASEPPDREMMCALVLPEDRARMVLERLDKGRPAPHREDGTFRHQFRIRRPADGEVRSVLALGRVFYGPDGVPTRVIGVNLDITDRTQAEQRQALLTRELDHRAKNALAVVQAALRLTPRDNPDTFARAVEGRVAALTRAHTLLAEGGWSGAELRALLEGELEPFLGGGTRAALDGPRVVLATVAAQPIAMALHELATNALKYGALSAPGGQVAVQWRIADGQSLQIEWTETGGPAIADRPRRRGFGTRMIEATLGGQLGGTVRKSWLPTGMVCHIELPLARVAAAAEAPPEISFAAQDA